MTIDDRLRRAGEQFRTTHTEAAEVHLRAPARAPARAPRTPTWFPRRRLVGLASTVVALVAVTVGVVVWVGSSRPGPRPSVVAASPQAPAADLADGPWQFAGAETADGPVPQPGSPLHSLDLRFDPATGQVSVGDGCNTLVVATRVDGADLVFSGGSGSGVACAESDPLDDTVSAVFARGSATWAVAGDRLTIRRDGTTLSYDRAGPRPSEPPSTAATTPVTALTGATWRLADVDTGSPPVLHPATAYTLSVAGTDVGPAVVRLDDSCNLTNIPVILGAGTFVVTGPALTTAVECDRPDDPAVTAAVRVFAAATITWSVEGDDLTLRGAGTTLTFTRA